MTQTQETYPEFVGGAGIPVSGDTDDAKGIITTQNEDQQLNEDGRKETEFVERRGIKVRRQPLATRHLDPDEMGMDPNTGQVVPQKDHRRWLVRKKYTFLYGKKLAYNGPCVLWLTDEEVEGQEHKVELLDSENVATFRKIQGTKPIAIKENTTIKELKKNLMTIYSQAEALKAEIAVAEDREKKRSEKLRKENPTVDLPGKNELVGGLPVPDAQVAAAEGAAQAEAASKEAVETAKAAAQAGKDLVEGQAADAAQQRAEELQEHVPSEDAEAMGDKSAKRGPGRPPGSKDSKPRNRRRKLKLPNAGGDVDSPTGANPAG